MESSMGCRCNWLDVRAWAALIPAKSGIQMVRAAVAEDWGAHSHFRGNQGISLSVVIGLKRGKKETQRAPLDWLARGCFLSGKLRFVPQERRLFGFLWGFDWV